MSKDLLIYLPFLLAIGFVGSYFGKRILNYIPQTRFRVLSLVLVLIVGIITLINVF
jgi:uncharacterized protein